MEAEVLDLTTLSLPLYNPRTHAAIGVPEEVGGLSERLEAAPRWVICTPEYNGSIPPVLTSAIAWLSVQGEGFRSLFNGRPIAIATHSGGPGVQVMAVLRLQLAHLGAHVVGRQLTSNRNNPAKDSSIDDIVPAPPAHGTDPHLSPHDPHLTPSPASGDRSIPVVVRPAAERFHSRLDWLESWHSFSFSHHHDPQWMGFGPLRVINDDTIAAGRGFGLHPHRDMEIVTVMVEGELSHRDSMGHSEVLRAGEVQAMSAGTGVVHSEMNLGDRACRLLQIWIEPTQRGLPPGYRQAPFPIGSELDAAA